MGSSESKKFSINSNRLNKAHTTMKSAQTAPSIWHALTLLPVPSPSIWKPAHGDYTYLTAPFMVLQLWDFCTWSETLVKAKGILPSAPGVPSTKNINVERVIVQLFLLCTCTKGDSAKSWHPRNEPPKAPLQKQFRARSRARGHRCITWTEELSFWHQ